MQYDPIGKLALVGVVVLAAALSPIVARAEVRPCSGVGTGGPTCPPAVPCTTDAECFGASGQRCVAGFCADDCGSLFTCSQDTDCPNFDPLVRHCQMATISGASGVCEYADAADNAVTTLCATAAGTTVSFMRVQACFSGGSNWALGDCDGDHVANGVDAAPCDGTMVTMNLPQPSPFCLPGHVCEGLTSVCAPVLRCAASSDCAATAIRISARSAWQCLLVPGSTTLRVCQPSCDATAQCPGGMADCGPFGNCVSTGLGRGYCEANALMTCGPTCRGNTLNWTSPNGDCDGDGAQNGCDPHPCSGTSGDTHCTANAVACTMPDAGVIRDASTTSPDAGFDASFVPDASITFPDAVVSSDGGLFTDVILFPDAFTPGEDAAILPTDDAAIGPTEDAAITTPDAASVDGGTRDAGSSAMDASTTTPFTPGTGFGGGGGCRCATPGSGSRPATGAIGVGVVVALALRGRRRRR